MIHSYINFQKEIIKHTTIELKQSLSSLQLSIELRAKS